ncbi:MAG: 4Fe-4S binding protein, partial [Proteobacteria bacterium]|nr:4Fe-4S binding protein [Pseudomonadota bacterium]
MVRKSKIPVYLWRRLSQLLFFALFLFLFIKTDYSGSDELEYAVNILFRIDPLLALAAIFAGKTMVALMLPALITLVFTFVSGRSFCGWICPMGTLVDGAAAVIRPPQGTAGNDLRAVKYYLLVFILVAAFLGLPLAGYLDPFSLLVRAFSFALYPAFDFAVSSFFGFTYLHAPDWVNAALEPVYEFLKNSILPFTHRVYGLSLFSLLLFAMVLVLNHWQRRFFCRNLCPLGGLLALVSRFSLLAAHGGNEDCGKCRKCRTICRMGAIDEERR